MKPILEINHVSKKFQIQSNIQPYLSLRESVLSFLKPSSKKEEFWALKDVSFNVMPGDTIGIIGKNGAGKSTLLKILSKITPPTTGSIISRGRIASLLEVGTGFHPELSGRENIFMNGSILGMRRAEITRNFDAIVDFAGVEKFLDTPLKHYSSGMQLRLAFAVAAFLENEILIIDEVLAVGDAEFQKKCMGKMADVSKSGRTILFVSHNMTATMNICNKGMLLHEGSILYGPGSIASTIERYNSFSVEKRKSENLQPKFFKNKYIRFNNIVFDTNKAFAAVRNNQNLVLKIDFHILEYTPQLEIGYRAVSSEGHVLYWSFFYDTDESEWPKINQGHNVLETEIPLNIFNTGTYRIEVMAGIRNDAYFFMPGDHDSGLEFELLDPLSTSPLMPGKREGLLGPIIHWKNTA